MRTAFDNMFISSEESIKEDLRIVNNAMDKMVAIVKAARACLNHQDFNNYKEQYEKEEHEMMSVMIAYTNNFVLAENANPTMYAMRMAMFVQKVYDLRRLLKSVEIDAQRKTGEQNGI